MKQCKANDLKPEEFHNVIVSQAVFSFCFNLSRPYLNIYFLDVFIRAYFLSLFYIRYSYYFRSGSDYDLGTVGTCLGPPDIWELGEI